MEQPDSWSVRLSLLTLEAEDEKKLHDVLLAYEPFDKQLRPKLGTMLNYFRHTEEEARPEGRGGAPLHPPHGGAEFFPGPPLDDGGLGEGRAREDQRVDPPRARGTTPIDVRRGDDPHPDAVPLLFDL